jgi:hypothetical protein
VTAHLHHHQWPGRSFTSQTSLQVGKRQWHGARTVHSWWQTQFRLGLRISLASAVSSHGNRTEAIVRRSTRTGACARVCLERATWQFQGARIRKLTLMPLSRPTPAGPPVSVPTPPASYPPRGTPTIPS